MQIFAGHIADYNNISHKQVWRFVHADISFNYIKKAFFSC